MTELQIAAMRSRNSDDANFAKLFGSTLASGSPISDEMAQRASAMIQRSEMGGGAMPQDFTKTPGAVAPVQGQQPQGAPKQVQKGGMYYLTDAHGIVLKGPSQTPLQ